MFGISFSEILLILVISLLIFGPQELPHIAAKLGKLIATIRNMGLNFREQIYEQSGFNQLQNIRAEMQETIQELKSQLNPVKPNYDTSFVNEDEFLYQEYQFLYQPELEFDRQPELFDEH